MYEPSIFDFSLKNKDKIKNSVFVESMNGDISVNVSFTRIKGCLSNGPFLKIFVNFAGLFEKCDYDFFLLQKGIYIKIKRNLEKYFLRKSNFPVLIGIYIIITKDPGDLLNFCTFCSILGILNLGIVYSDLPGCNNFFSLRNCHFVTSFSSNNFEEEFCLWRITFLSFLNFRTANVLKGVGLFSQIFFFDRIFYLTLIKWKLINTLNC
mmetsp:Transcript_23614/g.47659  ORF Transcript_23614/g.47659 Transcript_23614/m.47659 type:complete len:208 (+) Transcript_23614:1142-1765(+)